MVQAEQSNLYANMLALDPSNTDTLKAAAKFARDTAKDPTLAMEYLQSTVRLDPGDSIALVQLASILADRGLPDQAQQLLEGALELSPTHPQGLCEYGRLCEVAFGDVKAAFGMYHAALQAEPSHVDALVRMAALLMSRGGLEHAEERLADAEGLLERVLHIASGDARALGQYAAVRHERFLLKGDAEDADAAEGAYIRAITADPSRVQSLCGFGSFEAEVRRDAERAELLFRTALEIDIRHCETLTQYANLLRSQEGKEAAADDMYRRALASDRTSVDALNDYAHFLHRNRDDGDAAASHFSRALLVDPAHLPTLNNYAAMLLERAEPGEECHLAEKLLFDALKLAPSDVDTVLNCATFLWEVRREPERARQMCLRAIKARPNHVGALCQYAIMQLKMDGDAEAAMRTIERAREIDPANEFVVQGGEWFRNQMQIQRADTADQERVKALARGLAEKAIKEGRVAPAAATSGGEENGRPGGPTAGQHGGGGGGAAGRRVEGRREVEGPKAPPRYETVGLEKLPDDMPDGTVMSDANIGCLVGSNAVANAADGYPGGARLANEEEVEEMVRQGIMAANQGFDPLHPNRGMGGFRGEQCCQ